MKSLIKSLDPLISFIGIIASLTAAILSIPILTIFYFYFWKGESLFLMIRCILAAASGVWVYCLAFFAGLQSNDKPSG